jgi:hypothetical protein
MVKNLLQTFFGGIAQDPGVKYIEDFHKRKFETINKKDILTALENAAINGSGNKSESKLDFVGNLIKGTLALKISKEERLEIFKLAAQKMDEALAEDRKKDIENDDY